jgi:hypothetical protein
MICGRKKNGHRFLSNRPIYRASSRVTTDMPVVTIRYSLPDEQGEYDAARLGSEAMQVLWQIDQTCRSLLKHGSPTAEERRLAEEIRAMIPGELLDI